MKQFIENNDDKLIKIGKQIEFCDIEMKDPHKVEELMKLANFNKVFTCKVKSQENYIDDDKDLKLIELSTNKEASSSITE